MSIRYENLGHAAADKVMGAVVWVLRLAGIPAAKAHPAPPAEPWAGKRITAGPAEVRVLTADEPPASPPASFYCTYHGWHCTCGGAA